MTPSFSSILALGRLIALGAILVIIAGVYGGVSRAYFCGDDDFLEGYRAAFEDAQAPVRMFTTPHFSSFKYRPLNRVLNLLTFRAGAGSAQAFRLRNLAFHLGNVTLLYILSGLLGQPAAVSLGGALLFGLHPLSNQGVIEAISTNTAADFIFLLGLIAFVLAVRSQRPIPLMAIAGLLALTTILFYDANIVIFACMYAYLAAEHVRGKRPRACLWFYVTALMLSCGGFYLGMRILFVRSGFGMAVATSTAAAVILKNVFTYIGAVLLPVDPVTAHNWFGTPLPSQLAFQTGTARWAVIALAGLTGIGAFAGVIALIRIRRPLAVWAVDLFLVCSAALLLGPVLVFNPHPSETYLYLPMAFLTVVGASIVVDLCGLCGRATLQLSAAAILVLAAWCGIETLVRNRCVENCAFIARKILTSIPASELRPGISLVFFDAGGGAPSEHYGSYGFRGLDTIGNRPGERSRSVQCSLRLFSDQAGITARVLDASQTFPETLKSGAGEVFFSVQSDGSVAELRP